MTVSCGVLDYSVGNLGSVFRAIEMTGASPSLVQNVDQVLKVDVLVLPGVGAFGPAIATMRERGLVEAVRSRASADSPILGICLGMHLLFEGSEESDGESGIGIFPGIVRRLPDATRIGWETVTPSEGSGTEIEPFGVTEDQYFFFCHNYHVPASVTNFAQMKCNGVEGSVAILRKGNLLGLQFHPERSQRAGIRLLKEVLRGPWS